MRVYELAKKLGVPNKDILDAVKGKGEELQSHMSVLSDEQVFFLEKFFGQKDPEKAAESGAEKSDAPKGPEAAQVKESRQQKATDESIVARLMTVAVFAKQIGKPSGAVILTLLHKGIACAKNQMLSGEQVSDLAAHYGISVREKEQKRGRVLNKRVESSLGKDQRLPVVVVVGHVDHGKTTLLDYIRKTRVVAREKGGITQHIGAYEAKTSYGSIVFLDTPGHAAFSKIRARGIGVADVVVIIIAADDGIMPQTIEAIRYAKETGVPIIVAINKIDRAEAVRVEVVKRELSQYDLLPEEWGGDTICVPVSAKTGKGVDQLLQMISLQAELLELKADLSRPAQGYIIESTQEKGRGAVATVIGRHGTLKVGDYFSCGATFGKVNSLVDSYGNKLEEVGPSTPVIVAGLDSLPEVGDFFEIVSSSEYKGLKASGGKRRGAFNQTSASSDDSILFVVKVDTNSTKEALLDAIQKIDQDNKEQSINVVYAGVGDIIENDVMFASDIGATILGLHVKEEQGASALAQRKGVKVILSGIIYKLLEELEILLEGKKEVVLVKKKVGEALVRKVFDIKDAVISGVYVQDGVFSNKGEVVVWRRNKKIGGGKIKSLQRDRKIVKEVHKGFECAFIVDDYADWQVDDRVECYIDVPKK